MLDLVPYWPLQISIKKSCPLRVKRFDCCSFILESRKWSPWYSKFPFCRGTTDVLQWYFRSYHGSSVSAAYYRALNRKQNRHLIVCILNRSQMSQGPFFYDLDCCQLEQIGSKVIGWRFAVLHVEGPPSWTSSPEQTIEVFCQLISHGWWSAGLVPTSRGLVDSRR